VDFVQYVFEEGVLKLRTLRDAAVDKTRKEIEQVINAKNSYELLGDYDFTSFGIEEHKTEGNFTGLSFKLILDSGIPLYIHINNMGDNITFSYE
jgi:hypothetical protein